MSAEHGSISGRVVNAAGAPVAGASVALSGSSEAHRDIAALTSADGRFRFSGMRAGSYQVTVHAKNSRQSANVVVTPGPPADVEIRLND